MNSDTVHMIRSFAGRWRGKQPASPGRRCALFLAHVPLLFGIARAQVPTVTALPYLLTDQAGVIKIVASPPMSAVPPAVQASPIGGLLGGGFGSVLNSAILPTQAVAQAAAIAGLRAVATIQKANAARAKLQQLQNDTEDAVAQQQQKLENFDCSVDDLRHRFGKNARAAAAQTGKSNGSPHKWKALDAGTCMLPQEQEAEEAESQLEAIDQSGDAAQEAIEAAEEAAEAAESVAEAAEAAAEALVDGLDVLEGILDALSLF